MQKTWVQFLGWEDPLEKGKATHSRILACRIPWTVWSMGLQRVGHDSVSFAFACSGSADQSTEPCSWRAGSFLPPLAPARCLWPVLWACLPGGSAGGKCWGGRERCCDRSWNRPNLTGMRNGQKVWFSATSFFLYNFITLLLLFKNIILREQWFTAFWKWKALSRVQLFAALWTIAHQAPLSMGFSRQEYMSGLPVPSSRVS